MARMSLSLLVSLLAACSSIDRSPDATRLPESDRPHLYNLTSVSEQPQELDDWSVRLRVSIQHGLTVQKSPTLYFYESSVDLHRILPFSIGFTLIDPRSVQPVAEIPLQLPAHPGLQRIQLGEYGIELEPEVQYQWYVSEIWDSDSPMPKEIAGKMIRIAEGNIVRIDSKHLNYYGSPRGTDTIWRLIDARIWYDAFACVNQLIDASPDDLTLRDLRDELLGKCRHPYDRMPLVGPCFLLKSNDLEFHLW